MIFAKILAIPFNHALSAESVRIQFPHNITLYPVAYGLFLLSLAGLKENQLFFYGLERWELIRCSFSLEFWLSIS